MLDDDDFVFIYSIHFCNILNLVTTPHSILNKSISFVYDVVYFACCLPDSLLRSHDKRLVTYSFS
jgi:hypothetical protein